MVLKVFTGVLLATCIFFYAVFPAWAEEIKLYNPENETDIESWDRPPIKFGPFLLFSDIAVSQSYNDNILAQESGKQGDFITTIKPSAQISKSFGRHNFGIVLNAEAQRYREYDDENTLDMSAALLGDIEAYHSLHIPFTLAYSKEHQDRTNRRLSSVTEEPVQLSRKMAQSGFTYEPNRLKLEFLGTYEQLRVEDSRLMLTGTPVTGKDKDKDTLSFETTLTYDFRPNFKPVLKAQYSDNRYLERAQTATGFNGLNRNNKVFRTLAGFVFDYKGLIGGTALFGRENRTYEEAGAESVNGFSSEVTLNFAPTKRMKGELGYSERSYDDNLLLTGISEKAYTIDLEQELSSDWLAKAGGSYRNIEYLSSERVDDRYGASGSLVYRISRGLELEGSYRYQQRESTQAGLSFDQSIFMLTLRKQF
ncbi:MAG: outer membrane beta-barrel protein [Alphaproteobacteria bacterium]|nr:outer membrane beta-barrel protein [Alphaproteobacteria bacterium]